MNSQTEIQVTAWADACRLAIDLMSYSGNTFPANDFVLTMVKRKVISSSVEFAVHARRCLDETKIRPQLGVPLWIVDLPSGALVEMDLRRVLDRIIHANFLDVIFGSGKLKPRFSDAGDSVAAYLLSRTDQKKEGYSEIHSMAWTFLRHANDTHAIVGEMNLAEKQP